MSRQLDGGACISRAIQESMNPNNAQLVGAIPINEVSPPNDTPENGNKHVCAATGCTCAATLSTAATAGLLSVKGFSALAYGFAGFSLFTIMCAITACVATSREDNPDCCRLPNLFGGNAESNNQYDVSTPRLTDVAAPGSPRSVGDTLEAPLVPENGNTPQ